MKKNELNDVWNYINKKDKRSCWEYTGSIFSSGYGRFFSFYKAYLAHRIVYLLEYGEIPKGLFVMHKCNNKLCCNPNHLTIGTNSRNQRHASMSGAFKPGETGIRGISYIKSRKYWTAQGYLNGKKYNLYTGPFKEKAISARKKWEKENGVIFNKEGDKQ